MIKNTLVSGSSFLPLSLKQNIRYFVAFCTLVLNSHSLASESATGSPLVLSEVLYHSPLSSLPEGGERGEFIEIYNPGCSVVDLAEYRVRDNNGDKDSFLLSGYIAPGQYKTITNARDDFLKLFGRLPDMDNMKVKLGNSGDFVELLHNNKSVDMVAWEKARPGWDLTAKKTSLIRKNVTKPGIPTDWAVYSGGNNSPGTPGTGNLPPPHCDDTPGEEDLHLEVSNLDKTVWINSEGKFNFTFTVTTSKDAAITATLHCDGLKPGECSGPNVIATTLSQPNVPAVVNLDYQHGIKVNPGKYKLYIVARTSTGEEIQEEHLITLSEDYYDNAKGKTGAELHEALNAIIRNQDVFSYKEVWEQLGYTDEDPDDTSNIIVLYAGEPVLKSYRVGGGGKNEPYAWNREHTWPKSHGFSSENMTAYTDLHHLRPSYRIINERRGNLDFDTVSSPVAVFKDNKVGKLAFEPSDGAKGAVARIMMYMDVRYDGNDTSKVPDLKLVDKTSTKGGEMGKLCTLLQWHYDYPVSVRERERNNRIYERQGNRNPFIDHPEFAQSIYGDRCPDVHMSTAGATGKTLLH